MKFSLRPAFLLALTLGPTQFGAATEYEPFDMGKLIDHHKKIRGFKFQIKHTKPESGGDWCIYNWRTNQGMGYVYLADLTRCSGDNTELWEVLEVGAHLSNKLTEPHFVLRNPFTHHIFNFRRMLGRDRGNPYGITNDPYPNRLWTLDEYLDSKSLDIAQEMKYLDIRYGHGKEGALEMETPNQITRALWSLGSNFGSYTYDPDRTFNPALTVPQTWSMSIVPTESPTKAPTEAPTKSLSEAPSTAPTNTATQAVTSGGGANGDPHFVTWGGKKYDFHGGCDLVLLETPGFADGLGLKLHIRTDIHDWWSSIKTAIVQVGGDSLEVTGGTSEIPYWINGVQTANLETGDAALGDFPVHFVRINGHQSASRIDLGHGEAISIETFKHFVRVNVKGKNSGNFEGSVGLMGSYPDGKMLARNMTSVVEDANEFGNEWQVLASEPTLFHNVEGVQHPTKCVMPDQAKSSEKRRRLGELAITEGDAALACARVDEGDRDACIFDVLATNDKEMAGSY